MDEEELLEITGLWVEWGYGDVKGYRGGETKRERGRGKQLL